MSELSRIDERLSQVVELLRCLVSEVRATRRILAEVDKRMNAVEDASAAKRNPAPACSVAESMCREKMGHGSNPHWCCLPKGHDGQHSCGVCALLWDTPNAVLRGDGPGKDA